MDDIELNCDHSQPFQWRFSIDLLDNMYFTDNRAQHSFIHQQIPIGNLLWFRYRSGGLGTTRRAFHSSSGAEDRAQVINIMNNKWNGVGKRNRSSCHINIITVEVVPWQDLFPRDLPTSSSYGMIWMNPQSLEGQSKPCRRMPFIMATGSTENFTTSMAFIR